MIHLKEIRTIMMCKRVALLCTGAFIVLCFFCSQPLERSGETEYRVSVSDFTATIDPINNIRLFWVAPVPKPDFYIVSKEVPGFSSVSQVLVSGDSAGYTDVADVSIGEYKYQVVPYKIIQSEIGADTIQGITSSVASVTIGKTVSFSINSGAASTTQPQVVINVVNKSTDLENQVASVRFTQVFRTVLIKDTTSTVTSTVRKDTISFEYNDAANVIPNDSLKKLYDNKYILSDGNLIPPKTSSVVKAYVPVFGATDGFNNGESIAMGASAEANIPWRLLQGNGVKRVFAEVTYVNGAKKKDTLATQIAITGYRITVTMKNTVNSNDAEMKKGSQSDAGAKVEKTAYFLNKPIVRFSVSIDGDATFSDTFYYWIATLNLKGKLDVRDGTGSTSADTFQWVETRPVMGLLTGGGALHDENYVYHYSLDPSNDTGRQNLSQLQYTSKGETEQRAERSLPFRLSGEEHFNEFAVPGKYWGERPHKLVLKNPTPSTVACDSVVTDSPEANYVRFMAQNNQSLVSYGYKEFVIVLLFKGKEFNDTRTVWSGGNAYASRKSTEPADFKYFLTMFDFVPPGALPVNDKFNSFFLANGDTVSSMFTFKLLSMTDLGQGRITSAKLVVAQLPVTVGWDYSKFTEEGMLPVTLSQMLSMRYTVIPYPIEVPLTTLADIQWKDIDPTRWQAGRYLLGVVTCDEWGNEGLAPYSFNQSQNITNPFMVHVVSGR